MSQRPVCDKNIILNLEKSVNVIRGQGKNRSHVIKNDRIKL